MKLKRTITTLIFTILVAVCLFAMCGCTRKLADTTDNTTCPDTASNRVSFGKKYYALTGNGMDKNQYYQFNENGTAIYSATLEESGKTTFKSTINFKWFYAGEGEFILLHNGTKISTGTQNSAMGIGRTMHTSKCAMYWDNMYFVCETCANAIPNYAQIVK